MINASCPARVPIAALTRLLFYHRVPGVAEIHGHLDTVQKSFREKVSYRESSEIVTKRKK